MHFNGERMHIALKKERKKCIIILICLCPVSAYSQTEFHSLRTEFRRPLDHQKTISTCLYTCGRDPPHPKLKQQLSFRHAVSREKEDGLCDDVGKCFCSGTIDWVSTGMKIVQCCKRRTRAPTTCCAHACTVL